MNTRIVASDISNATIFAFCFISNRITITDNLCITAVCDRILLAGNICINIFRDRISVAICHCRIIRRPADSRYTPPRQGACCEGDGDDAG